jgi:hypothetical protein
MTNHRWLLGIGLGLGLAVASCTENNGQSSSATKSDLNLKAVLPDEMTAAQANSSSVMLSSRGAMVSPMNEAGASGTGAATAGGDTRATAQAPSGKTVATAVAAAPAPKEDVSIPKDAKWTIFCTVVGGPAHSEQARQLKARLAEVTHSSKWYVVHDDEKSTIYYGFYRTIDHGTREGDQAQADRRHLMEYKNSAGESPLALCSFMLIDRPAPEAPAEWDLAHYPRDAMHMWSLQIAAYTPDAADDQGHDRKWAAVESVKALRAQGIPAYFYHGDAISSVCVGLWPESAVKRQEGGNDKGNAGSLNSDTSLFVASEPLPEGMAPKAPTGEKLKPMTVRFEPIDATMLEMARKFPSHMTNNVEIYHKKKDPRTGKIVDVAEPSFWVKVPEVSESTAAANQQMPIDAGQLPTLPPALLGTDNRVPQQPGAGRLRQVGQ